MTRIAVEGLTKRFDGTVAVDRIDLAIDSGELFFLLGPTGCGKTTVLRLLAGLLEPDAGRIVFDHRDVTTLPPHRRSVGMVFQGYALWPHMTVLDNVASALRVRRLPRAERRERAADALRTVRMDTFKDRKPGELSGGEQQRVALARALAIEPEVLLLDEPLSHLDAEFRAEMRLEITRICRATRITTVVVTHDRAEALSMADKMAVQLDGRIRQVGTPQDLYERPRCSFVARFVGEANLLPATVVESRNGLVTLDSPVGRLAGVPAGDGPAPGSAVTCVIRPERIRLADGPSGNALSGRIGRSEYLGDRAQQMVELDDGTRLRVTDVVSSRRPGDRVGLIIHPSDVVITAE